MNFAKTYVTLDHVKRIFPQSEVQINVMNPNILDNTLMGKDWSNPSAINFSKANKQCVKSFVQMNKQSAKVHEVMDEVEEFKTPFKLACWDKVEAKRPGQA